MGVIREVKGRVKEAAGELLNDDDMAEEGRDERKQGAAERRADRARIEEIAADVEARTRAAKRDLKGD